MKISRLTRKQLSLAAIGIALCVVAILSLTTMFSNTANAPHSTDDEGSMGTGQLAGQKLFVDPDSNAAKQAKAWQSTQPEDAALMSKLAKLPTSRWVTSPAAIDGKLDKYLSAAKVAKATATLVVYNIPDRDCGAYSAGGAQSLDQYKKFIDSLATKIGDADTIVIIEPDAIAAMSNKDASGKNCLNEQQLTDRYEALRYAVESFTKLANATVYLDAGHSSWNGDINTLSERLNKAGLDKTDGFSLNVSNFQTDQDTIEYGTSISELSNNKRFVIDTSRNGLGRYENEVYPEHDWCNPPGRALGHKPTTNTGQTLVDAYLYIKYPGESDGQDADKNKCFGGPAAGQWWPEYALELIKRWPSELQ